MTFLLTNHPRFLYPWSNLNPLIQLPCSLSLSISRQLPLRSFFLFSFYYMKWKLYQRCKWRFSIKLCFTVSLKSEHPLMLLIFCSELLLLFNQIKFNKFRFPQRLWGNLIEIFQPSNQPNAIERVNTRMREQHTYKPSERRLQQ